MAAIALSSADIITQPLDYLRVGLTYMSALRFPVSSLAFGGRSETKTMTGSHRRILVVEDDPETAGQLVESLTTSGYQVDLAASGNEALSRGAARDYAVITIDRMLPDIEG